MPVHAVHTVFSVDGSRYQRWQADLLAYSHRKAGQPGPLTRLCSSPDPPAPFAGETVWTTPFRPHPATGDDDAAFNNRRPSRNGSAPSARPKRESW